MSGRPELLARAGADAGAAAGTGTGTSGTDPDALHAHAERMDRMYRLQRYVYDATRKYYLLGRDTMLTGVAPGEGQTVLEIGCGTGRNLIWLARRYPHARFFGIDASEPMLDHARAAILRHGVADRVQVSAAMAETVDPQTIPGLATPVVDRIVISYALSMMIDWRAALDRAAALLASGGSLHIVDFWDFAGYPAWVRRGFTRWLAAFGVHHRPEVLDGLRDWATRTDAELDIQSVLGRYAWIARATRSQLR